ncbi:MAG: LPS assembly lipoprotein LptE [Betaproteobacteria bacterium]
MARVLVAVAWVATLAGCGFHLRGDVHYAFSSLYVSAPASSPLAAELKRALEGGGTTIAETAAAAQAELDLLNVSDDKQVLSLTGGGRVREYSLAKRVTFGVRDSTGRDWLPAAEIVIRRSYSFNESEVLAREAQEARLLREMQTDAVQQIVRRLQSAKKPE